MVRFIQYISGAARCVFLLILLLMAAALDVSVVRPSLQAEAEAPPVITPQRVVHAEVILPIEPATPIITEREKSVLRDSANADWAAGLAAYRKRDMKSASAHFRALLSDTKDLPSGDRAASAFWAYRSLHEAGDDKQALAYAKQAAGESVGFYSILAQHVIGAQAANSGNEATDNPQYPIPHWKPTAGYRIAPALLFAIMRQESGFNPNARSAAGALGVMQLMPETAHAMARSMRVSGRSADPSVSMTLGQSYLEHLMDAPFIADNLIYLTASYNAGPGTVLAWKHRLHCESDPLLFVESIPYGETREYVVSVLGNYWVYSQLLGNYEIPSVASLAGNQWPLYSASDAQLAQMQSRLSVARVE